MVLYRGNGEDKAYVCRVDTINCKKSDMGIYGVVKLRSHIPREMDIQRRPIRPLERLMQSIREYIDMNHETLHDIKKGPYWVRHEKKCVPLIE